MKKLSKRQRQVLTLLGRGIGTASIARILRRSVKTVETYRDQIKKRLGIKSAPELVKRAVELRYFLEMQKKLCRRCAGAINGAFAKKKALA